MAAVRAGDDFEHVDLRPWQATARAFSEQVALDRRIAVELPESASQNSFSIPGSQRSQTSEFRVVQKSRILTKRLLVENAGLMRDARQLLVI